MTMRALLVSYAFPPVGGAGVGRVLKLSKFLPEHQVEPTVLTVANPSVPVTDASLSRDVRPELEVLRARTFEPGYAAKQAAWESSADSRPSWRRRALGYATAVAKGALVPDPQVLWQPDAQRVLARRLWGSAPDDVVFISGPPFSQFLLAPLVRLRRRPAVVLDYRDEWMTYRTTYEMMGRVSALVGGPLERALLRLAHAVTTATEAFRNSLLTRFGFLDPDRVHTIPNGYDPDDFPSPLPEPPADRFVVTYAGTIFKLTDPRGLLGAVRKLHEREPELARLLEVRFIGRVVDTEREAFEGMDRYGVSVSGYMDKEQVTRELARSHMVVCLLADAEACARIYPGKIFELMYLGRPCLTVAPDGVLADLAERHRLGPVLAPRDEDGIARALERALRQFRDRCYGTRSAAVDIEQFHRRVQAGEFARVFEQAAAAAGRR